MIIRELIYNINKKFIFRIIREICITNLHKNLKNYQINMISKNLKFKMFQLNTIYFWGIMVLTVILNIYNVLKFRIDFLEQFKYFHLLKSFYSKLVVFIFFAIVK